jgi:hypothetical protein
MNKADKFTIRFGLVLVSAIACTVGSYKIGQRNTENSMIEFTAEYGKNEYNRGIRDGKNSLSKILTVRAERCESGISMVTICTDEYHDTINGQRCASFPATEPCRRD